MANSGDHDGIGALQFLRHTRLRGANDRVTLHGRAREPMTTRMCLWRLGLIPRHGRTMAGEKKKKLPWLLGLRSHRKGRVVGDAIPPHKAASSRPLQARNKFLCMHAAGQHITARSSSLCRPKVTRADLLQGRCYSSLDPMGEHASG